MRTLLAAVLLASIVLAGCSSKPEAEGGPMCLAGGDSSAACVTNDTGAISGILVDPAIRPIAGVHVALALPAGGNRSVETTATGAFAFKDLAPGTYFLSFTHLLYHALQTSVEVKAGELASPRVQMDPVFSQKPYHELQQFKGHMLCGYDAIVLGSPCVFDYTQLACGGGCNPTAHDILIHAQGDTRYFVTNLGPGWQTEVIELNFDAPGAGISKDMVLSVSFFNRTSSDFYGRTSGASPLQLRFETGVPGPGQQGADKVIHPEGQNDLYIFLNVAGSDPSGAGLALQQDFRVFQSTFYHAKPQADWSFVKGDDFPF
jgi:hypothetical protein